MKTRLVLILYLILSTVFLTPAAAEVVTCSTGALIAAIVSTNTTPGPATLDIASGCTYTLTDGPYATEIGPVGLPIITSPITINGNGATIARSTADGVPLFRIFQVEADGALALNHLTITGGAAAASFGGGILNNTGTVSLTACTVTGNSAGESGGGIISFTMGSPGSLTVSNSTISENLALGDGGGIFNSGAMTVTGSTFYHNNAQGMGGAISQDDGSSVVANSTFYLNVSAGRAGAINNGASLTIYNSTIAGNVAMDTTGGILSSGSTLLKNTILSENNPGGNCRVEGTGVIDDGGGNLVWGDKTCPGAQADPKLGLLTFNGGHTHTMALLAGSAAIDTGVDTVCSSSPVSSLDQRGYTRPGGAHCDKGAYEAAGGGPPLRKVFLPRLMR